MEAVQAEERSELIVVLALFETVFYSPVVRMLLEGAVVSLNKQVLIVSTLAASYQLSNYVQKVKKECSQQVILAH